MCPFAAVAALKAVAVEPVTAVAAESAWLASQPSAPPLPEVISGLFEAVVAVEGAGAVGSEDGKVDGPARLVPCAAAAEPAGNDTTKLLCRCWTGDGFHIIVCSRT